MTSESFTSLNGRAFLSQPGGWVSADMEKAQPKAGKDAVQPSRCGDAAGDGANQEDALIPPAQQLLNPPGASPSSWCFSR